MLLWRGILLGILVVLFGRASYGAGPLCSEVFLNPQFILQSLVQKAEKMAENKEKDPDFAQKLVTEANRDIDISNPSPLHLRAFAAAGKIKGNEKRWELTRRFGKNPQEIQLGEFPDHGIEAVSARISFLDLSLNKSTKERLMGVTYIIRLVEGDLRSENLQPVMRSLFMDWNRPNAQAAYKRRLTIINSHKKQFDVLAEDSLIRVLHSVISLNRLKKDSAEFTIPTTEVNPLQQLREARDTGEISPYFILALRELFDGSLSGRREVKVMNGYQNGDNRNPRHR